MHKITFIFFFNSISLALNAQIELCSVNTSDFLVRRCETHFYSDGYGIVMTSSFDGRTQFNFIHNEAILAENKCENCRFEYLGLSSDGDNLFVYLNGVLGSVETEFFLKFNKATNLVTSITELNPIALEKGDRNLFGYTDISGYCQVISNEKLKLIKIIRLASPENYKVQSFPFSKQGFDVLRKKNFKMVGLATDFTNSEIEGDKAFLRNGNLSLISLKNDILQLFEFVEKEVKTTDYYLSGEATMRDAFICDNVLFVAEKYDNQIAIKAIDIQAKKELNSILIKGNDESQPFRKTPFFDTNGDTVERKWKKEKVTARILKEFNENLDIGVSKSSLNNYVITLSKQDLSYQYSNPAPSPIGGGVSYSPMATREIPTGQYRFFKGCVDSTFKITDDPEVVTPYVKALLRIKNLNTKPVSFSFDKEFCYLTYYNKVKKSVVVEKMK